MSSNTASVSMNESKSVRTERKATKKVAKSETQYVDKLPSPEHKTSLLDSITAKIKKLTAPRAVKGGEYFGTPGAGDSRLIGFFSTLFFIALWALVTEAGLIKPMFLPSPFDVDRKSVV